MVARRGPVVSYSALLMIGLAGFVAAPRASGGLVPISRLSELHVQGQHGQTPINENLSFEEFGRYDNLISKAVGEEGSNRVRGAVEHSSVVDVSLPGRINVSGLLQADASVQLVPND